MMSRRTVSAIVVVGVAVIVSARWTLQADDARAPSNGRDAHKRSVLDQLEQPLRLPFKEPTSLAEVTVFLGKELGAPVVLDMAALKRLEITTEEKVQLELEGVRLKTGLKLLLDQARLTYRVVPEDNLLILTDTHGSEDPLDRVFGELKSLHREIHSLQDSMDDLRSSMGLDDEAGAKMRKPTIIEEMPGEAAAKPGPPATSPGKPRS
jgi:hypothetical protein